MKGRNYLKTFRQKRPIWTLFRPNILIFRTKQRYSKKIKKPSLKWLMQNLQEKKEDLRILKTNRREKYKNWSKLLDRLREKWRNVKRSTRIWRRCCRIILIKPFHRLLLIIKIRRIQVQIWYWNLIINTNDFFYFIFCFFIFYVLYL